MNPIEYLVSQGWRVTSDPNKYYDAWGRKKPWGKRDYTVGGYNYDSYCYGYHRAYDLGKYHLAPIPSVADNGEVVVGTSKHGNFGGQVVVAYPDLGIQVIYGHVSPNIPVKIGDKVNQGDIVGYQSNTNYNNVRMDSHLHIQFQPLKYFAVEREFVCTGIDPLKIDVSKPLPTPPPQSPQKKNIHVVQKGDTLWGISRKYDLSVEQLKEYNKLSSNEISIGQELNLAKPVTHVVKKGETLWGISREYGMTVNELKKLNQMTADTLSIGEVLKIAGEPLPDEKETKKPIVKPKPFDRLENRSRSLDHYFTAMITHDNGAQVRKRRGSRKTGFNWAEKAGYDLNKGDIIYVYEVHDGWYRIYRGDLEGKGSNEWVHSDVANKILDVFK